MVKYEPYLYNVCHDLMQKTMSFNDVAVVSVKGSEYRTHFWCMRKDDVIRVMNDLNEKSGLLKKNFLNKRDGW